MSHDLTAARRRLTRDHKAAVAALEHAHDCSIELRRVIAELPADEQNTPAVRLIVQAIDDSDVVYAQTRELLARGNAG
jgi:hypothetical protein